MDIDSLADSVIDSDDGYSRVYLNDYTKCIDELPPNYRYVLELKVYYDLPTKEIAAIYDIVNNDVVTISTNSALEKIKVFAKNNNITFKKGDIVNCGIISKSKLSDDGLCFVDEEVLAYTFTINQTEEKANSSVSMYFEVTDDGVVNFIEKM